MRVGHFVTNQNTSSALFNIQSHIATKVGELAHPDASPNDYDIAIFESPNKLANMCTESEDCIRVVMFHSTPTGDHDRIYYEMRRGQPHFAFVTHDEAAIQMEDWGYEHALVPFSFDTSRFKHLPYPLSFTPGQLGIDKPHKRFHEVEALSPIEVFTSGRREHSGGDYSGKEIDFYKNISCYVCGSERESGPLPPIEALLCGRPVISTSVGMMTDIIEDSGAGVLISDDLSDLPDAITEVRNNFEHYAQKAREFTLLDTSEMYKDVLEDLWTTS